MLPSLPLLQPRDAYTLWYSPSSTFSFAPPTQLHPDASFNASSGPSFNGQNTRPRIHTGISPLAQLAQDEASVEARKLNIQRFGATWIKPPGFVKTYQGELDEKAEREEAEAQMQDEEGELGADFGFEDSVGEDVDGEEDEEEQDLDNEIPEADDLGSEDDFGELDEDEEEIDLDAGVPDAEAETLWGDSDEEEEEDEDEDEEGEEGDSVDEEEAGYTSLGVDDAMVSSSTRASTARTDDSPQPAVFSHDEAHTDQPRRDEFHWRGGIRSRGRRHPDESMDIDSD